jgi:hypothetical protein
MTTRVKPATKKKKTKRAASAEFVIGRAAFAKISAVEGVVLTPAMLKRVADFDSKGLSAATRRREIIKAYKKKA